MRSSSISRDLGDSRIRRSLAGLAWLAFLKKIDARKSSEMVNDRKWKGFPLPFGYILGRHIFFTSIAKYKFNEIFFQ